MIINSGNRCPTHNKNVGGAANSYHVRGRAADIVIKGVSPDIVHAYLDGKYPTQYGLGKYKTFTHIDSRSKITVEWIKQKRLWWALLLEYAGDVSYISDHFFIIDKYTADDKVVLTK